jgi:hypothetical protein
MMAAPVAAPVIPTATVSRRRRETLFDSVIVRCPSYLNQSPQIDHETLTHSVIDPEQTDLR